MSKINKIAFLFSLLSIYGATVKAQKTQVQIKGNQFYINGKPTYEGRYWNGHKIEGLLMNSRMVQGVFDDLNPATVSNFAYPDTKKWDAERNNKEFIAAMPLWKSYGLNAFTLNMQGGSPIGYGNWDFQNPGFEPDGSLIPGYMNRLNNILKKADDLNMVVILGIFYFGQDQRLKDEAAVKNAVTNLVNWLHEKKYRNILIEINNETLGDLKHYDHEILTYHRVDELLNLAKSIKKDGYAYPVGTSFPAILVPTKNVIDASDFVLFHGNALRTAEKFSNHIAKIKKVVGDRIMPIINNEDDNHNFEADSSHFNIALNNYISWGFFDYRKKDNPNLNEGFQTIPVDWGINSIAKKSFFNKVKEITGSNGYKTGNPIAPDFGMADPHIYIFGGKPYLYTTRDLDSLTKGKFVMPDWHIWSTDDMVTWKHERTILPTETYMGQSTDCWATETVERNGKYYFYFSDKNKTTGVMVADNPTGPFKDALGKPMLDENLTTSKEYDPSVLIDNDFNKTPYIIFGHHRDIDSTLGYYIAKLNDDMISLAEKPVKVKFINKAKVLGGNDKPTLHKHKDLYYLSAGSHYAVSKNIYGPYTKWGNSGDDKFGLNAQAHGNYFEWNNQWFHTWCKFHLGKQVAYFRESYLTYVHYKADGTMVDDTLLLSKHFENGVGQYSATWDKIEAEWFMAAEGIEKSENKSSFEVKNTVNDAYIIFPNVRNIKANSKISFNIKAENGGVLEIRENSKTGELLGSIKIPKGKSSENIEVQTQLKNNAGTKNLCLVFKGKSNKSIGAIDWFRLGN